MKDMKKVYMTPFTKWLEAETEDMMNPVSVITDDKGDPAPANPSGEVLSRQSNSLWDSEE
jgi:hypothetical protein